MKKWLKITLIVIAAVLVVGTGALFIAMRQQGIDLVTYPMEEREQAQELPSDYGMPYEEVSVTTADGLKLVGWFIPSQNGATIIAQHGYHGNRGNMLYDADILYRHGYGVLMSSLRTHDKSDGEYITFGVQEMKDLEAWYQYLLTRDDVDPNKIGILGESMGGLIATHYAAENPNIRAVVLHSALASMKDSIAKGVTHFTGLPPFPFAPMIQFWAERAADIRVRDIDATQWIGQISPRPVFIMMGGADDHISIDSGQKLYDAAGEPKELWFEPTAGHHGLPEVAPEEYERRVVGFFDQYLRAFEGE
jgi:fermentation-respiration switch protein FrsA (DUF1100 family)